MPTEVELKLLIQTEDIARLRRHPLIKAHASGRARSRRLLSTYFDTPELILKQHRIALRVRRIGARRVQTLKGGGEVRAGLHSRGEWEDEVAHDQPDLTKIHDAGLAELFASPQVRDRLEAIFSTDFRRTVWLLQWDDGDAIELALDQGEVRRNGQSAPLCEIELELKAGNPARLYQVALVLQQRIPLKLENISKAERGYQLHTATPPPLVKAAMPTIAPDMDVAGAFQAIAWSCIGHWTANQQGVLESAEPEYIHQMRVALRRLRSALPLFTDAIPRESYAPIATGLKWLANELGPARNWDVFVTQTLPPLLRQFPDDSAIQGVLRMARDKQDAARQAARQALLAPRHDRLLLELGAWLLADGWHAGADEARCVNQPAQKLARRMLDKRHKSLHRHAASLADMPPEERHQVRIAVKKLRYATEFFAPLYPRQSSRDYIRALAVLQEELGILNDAATTHTLLDELPDADAGALGTVAGWSARGLAQHLASMETAWRAFCRCPPFWK